MDKVADKTAAVKAKEHKQQEDNSDDEFLGHGLYDSDLESESEEGNFYVPNFYR